MDDKSPGLKNTPEAALLLDVINERKPLHTDGINWQAFLGLAKTHNVIPAIFDGLRQCPRDIPENIYSFLRRLYLSNLAHNLRFWKEFLTINSAFKQEDIPFVPIKGMDILIRFYPAFDLRCMVDIDVLTKNENFRQAEKLLCALGYQKQTSGLKESYWRTKQCHLAFTKDKVILELHWGLDFKRGEREILPRLWERARAVERENYKINILSPEDSLFSFALHLRRYGNILSLKQVFDAERIINEPPGLNWDYLLKECRNGKIEATLYFILAQAVIFTDARVPTEVLRKLQVSAWQKTLIRRLLYKDTFRAEVILKNSYLKAHLLLYDNPLEPIFYLINIPYEQFCKFYALKPYSKKADLLYALRLVYMPLAIFSKIAPGKLSLKRLA